jgi:hypothetical protein
VTYTKPEVAVLGAASQVIMRQLKLGTHGMDGVYAIVPAYDLDE